MCGICGAFGRAIDPPLERMGRCQTHRGPESIGTFTDDLTALSNQRLRVIDVEGGDQPIYNEDGDVVVVYNGEIYNFQSLRDELRAAGHCFSTDTDTEVLVHGYEEYGTDLFERLNGMFAAAIYDATRERLLLVRDRVGIKPLYYAPMDDGLAFASEPKALLEEALVKPAVDAEALRYFLQLRYAPSETTLFKGIETLPPGTYLDLNATDDGYRVSTHQYWTLSDTPTTPPTNPAETVRKTLRRAVDRQLVSDVPVGFYLSGGIDTSSVVAMASEISDDPIHTFCMGFADAEWDERDDARAVANHFDTIHHELTIEGSFMDDFPEMIWHADEPKRNLYPYYVAQEMSDHVTVALGGLGADELFAGYVYRFQRLQELDRLRHNESALRKTLTETGERITTQQLSSGALAADDLLEDASALEHIDDPEQLYVLLNSSDVIGDIKAYEQRVFGDALETGEDPADRIAERWSPDSDTLPEQSLEWDFTVKLPDDFLMVEDRMSMAHSLESRVPFLDNELVDLAFSMAFDQVFGSGNGDGPTVGKAVLRDAMSDKLPEEVFQKAKQGFTMPTYDFVQTELLEHAERILANPTIVQAGYIDQQYLKTVLSRPPRREMTTHYKLLWKLVGLEIWHQMYIIGGLDEPASIEAYYT